MSDATSTAPRKNTPQSSFPDLDPAAQEFLRTHGFDTVLGYFASFEARVDANTDAFRELRSELLERDADRERAERARDDRLDKLEQHFGEIALALSKGQQLTTEVALTVARQSLNDAEEAKPSPAAGDDSEPPPPEVQKWLRILPRDQREKARQAIGFIVLAILALALAGVTKLGGSW